MKIYYGDEDRVKIYYREQKYIKNKRMTWGVKIHHRGQKWSHQK